MHSSSSFTLGLVSWLASTVAAGGAVAAHNSYWYDWGLYGAYPRLSYESFPLASPWVNLVQTSAQCEDGYTFVEPRGLSVPHAGPIILDNDGNLVWMETKYGQAMDVKVQTYRGQDYITFWHGGDSGWFGKGYYLMLDSSYQVFKNVTAAGDLDGDLHEFQITEQGTALLTAYDTKAADLSAYGVADGQIIDSLFQEIDLETGELLFQWRASDHYPVTESLAPYESFHGAWDYFHINSVSKDPHTGLYLVSSRYMCGVAAIDPTHGQVVWQLGGKNNSFTDLSDGAATNIAWQHHSRLLHNGTLLTVFDNGAYYNKPLRRAPHSRGLLLDLDTTDPHNRTAKVRQALVAPQGFLAPSQGSVNLLPATGNVLVGWGHTPAWTEFDAVSGEVLCDTHLGATQLAVLGWAKNYRTFKSPWVGRPTDTQPSAVLRRRGERALYVSWNGATEVERWVVRTAWAPSGRDDNSRHHDDDDDENTNGQGTGNGNGGGGGGGNTFVSLSNVTSARKQTFETRIDLAPLGDALGTYVQAQGYDRDGRLLGSSEWIATATGLYKSGAPVPVPETVGVQKTQLILAALALGGVGLAVLLVVLRRPLLAGARWLVGTVHEAFGWVVMAATRRKHQYNVLPQVEGSEMRDRGRGRASGRGAGLGLPATGSAAWKYNHAQQPEEEMGDGQDTTDELKRAL